MDSWQSMGVDVLAKAAVAQKIKSPRFAAMSPGPKNTKMKKNISQSGRFISQKSAARISEPRVREETSS